MGVGGWEEGLEAKLGLDHRRPDCQGKTWPSPSGIVWERKASLPVWVGSGEALVSEFER